MQSIGHHKYEFTSVYYATYSWQITLETLASHTLGRVTTKPAPGLDWTMDWMQSWTYKEYAETVFYSFLQCSKHYQVYVAILFHKMSCW